MESDEERERDEDDATMDHSEEKSALMNDKYEKVEWFYMRD